MRCSPATVNGSEILIAPAAPGAGASPGFSPGFGFSFGQAQRIAVSGSRTTGNYGGQLVEPVTGVRRSSDLARQVAGFDLVGRKATHQRAPPARVDHLAQGGA